MILHYDLKNELKDLDTAFLISINSPLKMQRIK